VCFTCEVGCTDCLAQEIRGGEERERGGEDKGRKVGESGGLKEVERERKEGRWDGGSSVVGLMASGHGVSDG
jgi:hypothetical protein